MSELTYTVPKNLVGDNETKAWGIVARTNDCNADMIVRTEHTDTEYVYVVDPEQAE